MIPELVFELSKKIKVFHYKMQYARYVHDMSKHKSAFCIIFITYYTKNITISN